MLVSSSRFQGVNQHTSHHVAVAPSCLHRASNSCFHHLSSVNGHRNEARKGGHFGICRRFWTLVSSQHVNNVNRHSNEASILCHLRNCVRFCFVGSASALRVRIVNRHRDGLGPGGRHPVDCRQFWTLVSVSRVPVSTVTGTVGPLVSEVESGMGRLLSGVQAGMRSVQNGERVEWKVEGKLVEWRVCRVECGVRREWRGTME